MRILLVNDDFPPISHTGPSIVAYNLAQGLIKSGHEVFVIASVQEKSQAGHEFYDGLSVYRIFSSYDNLFHQRFYHYLSLYNHQIIPKFKRLIAEIRPDVCHFHNVHGYISYGCFKWAGRHAKVVFLTAHDMLLIGYGKLWPKDGNCRYKIGFADNIMAGRKRYNPCRNLIIRHYLKYVDRIFCISQGQNDILKLNGIDKTETVYNAINADDWEAGEESVRQFKKKFQLQKKKIILFGARLSEAKGGEAAIRAMSMVAKAEEQAVMAVVGKFEGYAKQMMELAKAGNIADRIIFTGWLSREEMRSAFSAADVCVTPSVYFDPFNLFNIESMAAGKPVVGTCFGGTPEIVINNETGFIVNPLKTEEFAGRIIELLNDPGKAEKFGQAGYRRVKEKFSLERQVAKTLEAYNEFLS